MIGFRREFRRHCLNSGRGRGLRRRHTRFLGFDARCLEDGVNIVGRGLGLPLRLRRLTGFKRGAQRIGFGTSIPTAPAIADAYYRLDGERRYSLPLSGTPYSRK